MRGTAIGGRIAHGLLLLAYTSRASTMLAEACLDGTADWVPLALGFDRVRFLKPVRIGETITVAYEVGEVDIQRARIISAVTIKDEAQELVLVGSHIIKWVKG